MGGSRAFREHSSGHSRQHSDSVSTQIRLHILCLLSSCYILKQNSPQKLSNANWLRKNKNTVDACQRLTTANNRINYSNFSTLSIILQYVSEWVKQFCIQLRTPLLKAKNNLFIITILSLNQTVIVVLWNCKTVFTVWWNCIYILAILVMISNGLVHIIKYKPSKFFIKPHKGIYDHL